MYAHTPSIRDLELIDNATLIGRSELRDILIKDFGIQTEVVDWIIHNLEDYNDQLEILKLENKQREMIEAETEGTNGEHGYVGN